VDERGNLINEANYLNGFLKRYNKVLLDKTTVQREGTRVGFENAQLQMVLKQYLDGTSVNDDVINDPRNPLLVVNSKLQVYLAAEIQERERILQHSRQFGRLVLPAITSPTTEIKQSKYIIDYMQSKTTTHIVTQKSS
ncbi:hypothetical protein CBR_g48659, partial [Chara braunii]